MDVEVVNSLTDERRSREGALHDPQIMAVSGVMGAGPGNKSKSVENYGGVGVNTRYSSAMQS